MGGEFPEVTYLNEPLCTECEAASHPMYGIVGLGAIHTLFVLQSSDARVLDYPGYAEAFFQSDSGRTIDRIVSGDWSGIGLTNAVSCLFDVSHGGRQSPRPREFTNCRPNLLSRIERLNPLLVIACGVPAVNSVLGECDMHPKSGVVIEETVDGRRVLLSYHPRVMTREVKESLQLAVAETRIFSAGLFQEI